ncbi:bestrophin-like domain [Legionella sp. WA2024007413]
MLYALINNCFPTFLLVFFLLSHTVSHYRYKISKNKQDVETAMDVVGSISSFYSIFLGFIVYILWSNHQKSAEFVTAEATQLYIIGESSRAFPPEVHQGIVNNLTQYISSILNDELEAMSRGQEGKKTQEASDRLDDEPLKFKPSDIVSTYYNNAVSSFNQAIENRNFRLNMLYSQIPTAWYLIIFIGAFFIIGIYSLETTSKGHLFLIILCIFLAIYMTAITVLSFPFSGFFKVSDVPLKKVFTELNTMSIQLNNKPKLEISK